MATITQIRAALFAWVDGETALTTIWSPSNAPRPARPFVTMDMRPVTNIGHDSRGAPDNNGDAILYADREFRLEIRVYGELQPRGAAAAQSLCEEIKRSLQTRTVVDTLTAAEVGPLEALPTQDLSEIDRVDFESVFMFEARFAVTMERTEDVGFIATSDAPTGTYA